MRNPLDHSNFGRQAELLPANPATNSEPPRLKKHLGIALTPEQQALVMASPSRPQRHRRTGRRRRPPEGCGPGGRMKIGRRAQNTNMLTTVDLPFPGAAHLVEQDACRTTVGTNTRQTRQ